MKISRTLMMLNDRYPEAVNSSGDVRLQTAISISTCGRSRELGSAWPAGLGATAGTGAGGHRRLHSARGSC